MLKLYKVGQHSEGNKEAIWGLVYATSESNAIWRWQRWASTQDIKFLSRPTVAELISFDAPEKVHCLTYKNK